MNVYFDNAATTPLRKEVIQSISNIMVDCFGNPSSVHAIGRMAKTSVESARRGIAKLLNAEPQEIIFTSGGTESDNMILKCAVNDLEVTTIISSKIEHHAVIHAIEALKTNNGINTLYVETKKDGSIDIKHLRTLLQSDNSKKLVSLMHVNNEIGNILDLDAVGKLCHEHNALFHTDAVQGVGHFTYDMEILPIDFLSASGHKFHGPKGVGFSFVRKNSGLQPFIHGGSQERGMRAGTESVHNIVGMNRALELAYENLEEDKAKVLGLKNYFIDKLKELFPDVIFNGLSGVENKSTYTLINVALPIPSDKALMLDFHLDLKGIACSKGSACQSGSSSGSHVLKKIQDLPAKNWSSLRFSFSIFNTKEDVNYLIQVFKEFIG
ncbi:cysteine desulfurase [Flavobacteriaceae bacterium]|nr:cysteine desulfurase [Flavobacteriaceae bacterium]